MTKKLNDHVKAKRMMVRLLKFLNKINCATMKCEKCPLAQYSSYKKEFIIATGFECPKNQVRMSIQKIVGISRFIPTSE
jgi:hypothetical protein